MGTSKLSGKPDEMLGVTCDGLTSHPEGVAILLVTSYYGNLDKLWLCEPLGCYASLCIRRLIEPGASDSDWRM